MHSVVRQVPRLASSCPSNPPASRARQFLEIKWTCFRPAALRSHPAVMLQEDEAGSCHGFFVPPPACTSSGGSCTHREKACAGPRLDTPVAACCVCSDLPEDAD